VRDLERDHALDRPLTGEEQGELYNPEDALLAAANAGASGPDSVGPGGLQGLFEALEAQASFDRVLFDGGEFGTGADVGSDEELDFLGLPGLLDADQVRAEADHRRLTERPSCGPGSSASAEDAGRALTRSSTDEPRAEQRLNNSWRASRCADATPLQG